MNSVKWIKIVTDIFDDEKIRLLETLPDSDTILVIWFKLLTMAGKCNDSGLIYLARDIPYTDEMLSTLLRRPINTIRLALQEFENLKMIEIHNNFIAIINWEKHQNIEKLDKMKEASRISSQKYREKQKKLCEKAKDGDIIVTSRDTTDKIREEENREDKNNGPEIRPEIKELTEYLFEQIKSHSNPPKWNSSPPKLQNWYDDIEKLNRIDKIDVEQIKRVVTWSTKHNFWKSNILSGNSLRKHFDKLSIQMQNKGNKNNNINSPEEFEQYLKGEL
jgi:predicted phage replisome organizer